MVHNDEEKESQTPRKETPHVEPKRSDPKKAESPPKAANTQRRT